MILFASIFLTFCGSAFSITKDDCPSGLDHFYLQVHGNSCFEFVTSQKKDFFGAEKYCQEKNGHLTSIASFDENHWIRRQLQNIYFTRDEGLWIGYNDRHSEGHYEWLDGSRVSYIYWAPLNGARSPFQLAEREIDCAVINADTGYWYDQQCKEGVFNLWGLAGKYEKPYICRYEVDVPEDASSDAGSEDDGDEPNDSEDGNEPGESESEPPVAADAE